MLTNELNRHLNVLCRVIGARPVGSRNNQQAGDYVADWFKSCGLEVTTPEFSCWDWQQGSCTLTLNGQPLPAVVSPYSLPCDYAGRFVTASTISQLAAVDCRDRVLVLHGELFREPLMPKNFVFYNPDHHQEIIALLETKAPAAIVALTGKHPELAAAWYPIPLFENGDQLRSLSEKAFASDSFIAVEPWYQGDHMLFVMQGIAACALSTERLDIVTTEIAHTERDTLDNVDVEKLADLVQSVGRLAGS